MRLRNFGVFTTLLAVVHAAPDMNYVPLPPTTSPGGRCMDGSMAGYYIRRSSEENNDLFVIQLKGGGACTTKETCDARSGTTLGSSNKWSDSMTGTRLLDQDCTKNPDFCKATAVHIPYCTSDAHRGTRTQPSLLSWGYYFDGHSNFVAIIEKLILEEGLGEADNVLLTGNSAGAIGALFNLDWLAERLPDATVKGAPVAGWYFPAALEGDLPSLFRPSDYPHFAAGENGNLGYDTWQVLNEAPDIFQMREVLPADCLAAFDDNQWWACSSIHQAYRYIKTPLFNIHTQYDSNQIFTQQLAPSDPTTESERETVERYIEMWGMATRSSMQQILNDDHNVPKPHIDGIFSASCITHGTAVDVTIDGKQWMPLVRDWFFQLGQIDESYYRLIETCPPGSSDRALPCNAKPQCQFQATPSVPVIVRQCVEQLASDSCLQSFRDREECFQCARDNQASAFAAGCTIGIVQQICVYAESNDIDESVANGEGVGEGLVIDEGDLETENGDSTEGGSIDGEENIVDDTSSLDDANESRGQRRHHRVMTGIALVLLVATTMLL